MKNIHVIATDKPSRLHKYIFEGFALSKQSLNWKEAKHIYITNSEEIKEGDWVYYENGDLKGIHKVVNGQRPKTMILKKIILTTDQDLIKDGVQAIDDEFLNWFVKNPSCEFIEIMDDWNSPRIDAYEYKIIIPKEEPDYTALLKPVGTTQETLEEAAERYAKSEALPENQINCKEDFIAGAKWQQEQNKNKYSEEEVLSILDIMLTEYRDSLNNKTDFYPALRFEQFKNK